MRASIATVLLGVALLLFPFLAKAAETAVSCPELTGLQVAAGFITWMNILRVLAIGVGVVCLGYLLFRWFGWLLEIFLYIPKEVYEGVGYALSVGLIISGYWLSETNMLWPVLTGCLLFGAMLIITGALHKLAPNWEHFFGILFLVWSAVALFYQSAPVGFIAVAALMGLVGFSAAVIPCGYAIGFRDEDAVSRATTTAFIVLTGFVFLRVVGQSLPYIHVFEQGALWLGSFVGYVGLLIASSRWYAKRAIYPAMQLITILLGMAAIGAGSVFGIPQLLGIGGTFFVLYLIEKPFEIPVESAVGYATIGLFVSSCVGGGVWWAQNHMDLVRPYLLF
ncbi:MAG: hypothetical protein HYT22_01865 [Candidatus Niyogibacteria bacterium]|nr:hypothetical protein [Candidatus Niyogibacteria bacterium]